MIDRDALRSELSRMLRDDYEGFLSAEEVAAIAEYQTGRILALVRPVEGVVIEPPYQAAVHKLLWTALLPNTDLTLRERTEGEYFLAALAARLEALS